MSVGLAGATPGCLAERALYHTLAPWLRRFSEGVPDLPALTALLAEHPACASGGGQPLACVAPRADGPAYEIRVHRLGELPTRPGNWHDFFNALVWRAFPQAKAAINRRHLAATQDTPARGPVRDALTQFDECGVLVCSADPQLARGLAAHQWEAVFHGARSRVQSDMRFLVFGHGCYDQLRAPFPGLCGKALYRIVSREWLAQEVCWQQQESDAWLARWFADPAHCASPREFSPLPLLGVPGVVVASQAPEYYRNSPQFRPLAPGRGPAALAGV